MKEVSLIEHNLGQYNNKDLNYWRAHNLRHQDESVFNNKEIRLRELLDNNPSVRNIVVDIGAGVGWLSAKLSDMFAHVVAIEPSEDALTIAKELYKDKPNISWIYGFVEDVLPTLPINRADPVLFVTCSVFQHLDDVHVESVLNWMNLNAPVGSILSFQELWGVAEERKMHHVRPQQWWSHLLSNWGLNFHGPLVLENTCKGIHGKKVMG